MLANTFRTLLGLSIGDAYGVHFEFMSDGYIANNYPDKPSKSLGVDHLIFYRVILVTIRKWPY